MTKPFLKWVGGKTQILESVLAKFPKECNNYHEPFVGGGAVLLGMLSGEYVVKDKIYASDSNQSLIDLYKLVQSDPEKLISGVNSHISGGFTEKDYYLMRTEFNKDKDPIKFLILNKTCFRGLHREGPNGFNVPWGHYKKISVMDEDNIRQVSELIQNVEFNCQSFEISLDGVLGGDFVYTDPPYVGTFDTYNKNGFGSNNHENLFSLVKSLPCPFLMSNSNDKLVLDSFKGYSIDTLVARRAINSKNPGRTALEVLIN
jgi:DNA adenine methylase